MKQTTLAFVLLAVSVVAPLFAGGAEEMPAPLPGTTIGERFELILEPGEYYSKEVNYLVYRYTVWPQVAVWIETPDGRYIDTLYVTRVVVDQDFTAAPKEGRPEALPVWSHLDRGAGADAVDAVTSPTTVDSTVTYGNDLAARLEDGTYVVKLETNRSYDWNERYTKRSSGVNGQPSLIYEAEVTVGGPDVSVEFVPVGIGSVDGNDGRTSSDLSGIDTAFNLFSSMEIRYHHE